MPKKPKHGRYEPRVVITKLSDDYYLYIAPPEKQEAPTLPEGLKYDTLYEFTTKNKDSIESFISSLQDVDTKGNPIYRLQEDGEAAIDFDPELFKKLLLTKVIKEAEDADIASMPSNKVNSSKSPTIRLPQKGLKETVTIVLDGENDYYLAYKDRYDEDRIVFLGFGKKALESFAEAIDLQVGLMNFKDSLNHLISLEGGEIEVLSENLSEFVGRLPKDKSQEAIRRLTKMLINQKTNPKSIAEGLLGVVIGVKIL